MNLSLGIDTAARSACSAAAATQNPLGPAVEDAWNRGALPVIASGNSNQQLFGGGPGYSNLDAIVVGATGTDDTVAAYSSAIGSAKWGIVAPGGDDRCRPTDPRCTDSARTDCPMVLSTYRRRRLQPAVGPELLRLSGGHVDGGAARERRRGAAVRQGPQRARSSRHVARDRRPDRLRRELRRAAQRGARRRHASPTTRTQRRLEQRWRAATRPRRASRRAPVARPRRRPATTTPTTSPFTFDGERTNPSTTTARRPPRGAIVLNTSRATTRACRSASGWQGSCRSAFAALAMSYNLRKTLTTLP